MKALFKPLLLLCFFSVTTAYAQQPQAKESTAPPALTKQYYQLKERSNSYREGSQEYKVVSVSALDAFWKSVQQSLKATEDGLVGDKKSAQQEAAQARQTIEEQHRQLEALQLDNIEKEKQVQESQHAVNHLSVLGIGMQKQFYVILTGIIILGLVLCLLVGMQQYKSSKRIALEKQNEYVTMEQELNEHKKKARERELKIKRDLQTEMNLREEMSLELERLRKNLVHRG